MDPAQVLGIPPHTLDHAAPAVAVAAAAAAAADANRGPPTAVAAVLYRLGGPLVELSTFLLLTRMLDAVSATTVLLRGTIVNRTYGTHKKKLYIYLFMLTIFGPICYGPP